MLSAINEGISLQKSNISYLRGLSASCKKLYVDFKSLYEKDLYHSIAAVYELLRKSNSLLSLEDFQNYYFEKYKSLRPFIAAHETETKEFVAYVYNRIAK
jgi:hypothetical protein